MKRDNRRQIIRKLLLLISFAFFPLTVVYLAPAPPIMSIKAGVINLSVIVILGIFLSGFVFRRAFCGWICPGGGCQLIGHSLNDKKIDKYKFNWIRMILVIVWVIMMLVTLFSINTQPTIEPMHPGVGKFATSNIRFFLPYIPVVITIFVFVLAFGRRGFCARGCWIYPLIATSSKLGQLIKFPSLHLKLENPDNCKGCKLCTKYCPMSIDVYNLIKQRTILPNNCIQCGVCIDRCPKEEVYKFSYGIENKAINF